MEKTGPLPVREVLTLKKGLEEATQQSMKQYQAEGLCPFFLPKPGHFPKSIPKDKRSSLTQLVTYAYHYPHVTGSRN
eukprot:gene23077-29269_t